jgi:hypothetical protein
MRLAELSLPGRVYLGTAAVEPVRRISSEVEAVDAVLGGGLPAGRLSELLGPRSSGKTSVLLRLLAAATRRGEITAYVDLADALHPASAAAAGVDLARVLWVRPPALRAALRCTEMVLHAGGFALVVFDLGAGRLPAVRSAVWPRLLQAAERSHSAFVVLASQRIAGSFAALSFTMRGCRTCWVPGQWPLLAGFDSVLQVTRNKLGPTTMRSTRLRLYGAMSGVR